MLEDVRGYLDDRRLPRNKVGISGELNPHSMPVILAKLRQRLGSRQDQFHADFGPIASSALPAAGNSR